MCIKSFEHNKKSHFLIQSIYVLVRWSRSWWTFFCNRLEKKENEQYLWQSIENWDKIPFCAYFGLVFPDQVDYFSGKTLLLMKFQIHTIRFWRSDSWWIKAF